MSCQFDAMPNHIKLDNVFAKRTKLGTDHNSPSALGTMATNSEILGMLFDVDRICEITFTETGSGSGLDQFRQRGSKVRNDRTNSDENRNANNVLSIVIDVLDFYDQKYYWLQYFGKILRQLCKQKYYYITF